MQSKRENPNTAKQEFLNDIDMERAGLNPNLSFKIPDKLNISKFYKGLPSKFPFPKLRIFYLRLYLLYCSMIDK